jgi:hypothetical protein
MENIGGIAKIQYAFIDDVAYFGAWKGVVSMGLKTGSAFTDIQVTLRKCEVTCEPETSDVGTIYKPTAKLYVPFSKVQTADENWWRFPYCGVLLKYLMFTGETKLLGTLDNPLTGQCQELDPTNPAEYKGWLINLSGTQLHKQLSIKE